MTVDVKTIWGMSVILNDEQASILNQKLMDMAQLSLVTLSESVVGSTVVEGRTLVSTTNSFATVEAANEYIAFVNTFTPPPYSISIVS
jgi:hypothetical protein